MVALPICNIQLKAKKPDRRPYPEELITYGDHIRKKRLDLGLTQPQVAIIFNVTTDTVTNWELNRNTPNLFQVPKIILFLGYTLTNANNPIKESRIQKGLTQDELAKILEINPSTLYRIEKGCKKIQKKIRIRVDQWLSENLNSGDIRHE